MRLSSDKMTFLLLFFILAGSAFRLIHIGVPSMWVDEANTAFSAESIVRCGRPVMPTGIVYGRAPLYTYSVAFMLKVSNLLNLPGKVLEYGRITSAFYGILAIPLIYYAAAMLFGRRTGLIAAFFLANCPFEIGWSRVARMYTLLQFMTLLGILFFICGFGEYSRRIQDSSRPEKILAFFKFKSGPIKGVNPALLAIFIILMLIAYFWVHLLTIFTVLGLILYLLTCALYHTLFKGGKNRGWNKYSIFSLLILLGCMVVCFLPQIAKMWNYFLSYTPPWALKGSSANQTWILFGFIFSWYRYPLGILFVWGIVQTLIRRNRSGWMAILLFFTPLFALTFVFTHRIERYLFSVYPFFLMLAAYGLISILDLKNSSFFSKTRWLTRIRNYCIPIFLAALFLFTPWIKIGKNIPWYEDGKPNGAVYFEEWREASEILDSHCREGDMIITSLPEVLLYYGIHADWALNWNNFLFSQKRNKVDGQGRIIEVYTGRPLIDSLEKLMKEMNSKSRGWIVLSDYQYSHTIYIPDSIRRYIDESLGIPRWRTRNRSIRIYHWDDTKGPIHEL